MAEETVKSETENKVFYPCDVCQHQFSSQAILDAHLSGSKHQKKLLASQLLTKLQQMETCFTHDTENGTFLCLVCNIEVTSPQLLETHFAGIKHKNKASGGGGVGVQQPQQQTSNGQAGKRQLNTAAPPAKRVGIVAPTEGGVAPPTEGGGGGGSFTCNDCQKTFNSEVQMTQHLSSKKHLNRCLIAMFGTCNIQDTLTKSTRGRGGRGNNRGRGRGRGGNGGRGRSNYQTSSEWEANGPTRGNSQPVDCGSNGLIQPTPDWGGCGCACGNRGRGRLNQGHQQRSYSAAWEDNYDTIHYTNQGGFVNQGGYSEDSASYVDQNSVPSTTYTNQNHYSNQNIYSDQNLSNTQGRGRGRSTCVNRASVHDSRSSGGQGSYQQRGGGDQGWSRGGQSQGGGRGYQSGRGRAKGRGYQAH